MYWQWWGIPEALRIALVTWKMSIGTAHSQFRLTSQPSVVPWLVQLIFFFFKMRHLREFFQARICTSLGIFGVPSYDRYSVFLIFLDSFIPQDVVQLTMF